MRGFPQGYQNVVCRLVSEAVQRTGVHAAVEVGVARGVTSALLLRRCPGLTLTMVDPWRCDPKYMATLGLTSKKKFGTQAAWDEIKRLAMENTKFAADRTNLLHMPSLEAALLVPDASQAAVFIDGEHTYAAVTADAAAWWPKVVPGGTLLGDDYCIGAVRRGAEHWVQSLGLGKLSIEDKVWWIGKPI